MRLEIGQQIDNTRVRLDFRKGIYRAAYMPSYEIGKFQADEFVSKYNEQDTRLKKITWLTVIITSLIGGIIGAGKKNKKIFVPLNSLIGAFVGVGIGAGISHSQKNELMDKYNVKQLVE